MANPGGGTTASTSVTQAVENTVALDFTNYTGSYKQFWNLLLGTTDVASHEIVHEELLQRCNTIISGLIYYEATNPIEIPKKTEAMSRKDEFKFEIMKTMDVTEPVALELMSLFLLYEYKGAVNPLSDLLMSESTMKKFVQEVKDFYMKERLCLLYCSQAILSGAADENHPYSTIFSSFIASASMRDWCKWLCQSLKKAKNEDEHVQVLHNLCILLVNFGVFDGVLAEFSKGFIFGNGSSPSVIYAEAIVMYAFLQTGSGRPSADSTIETYLSKHVKFLVENPYMLGCILAAWVLRCSNNETIRDVTRRVRCPEQCVSNMCVILNEYSGDSFRSQHGLTAIVFRCIYSVAETILDRFEKNSFGEDHDWNQLLLTLIGDAETARTFMLEQPDELTVLYTEALMHLPVDVNWSLGFWSATCRAGTKDVTALSILERITEINALAKIFDGKDAQLLRPNGNGHWLLLRDVNIGGVIVPAGSIGQTVKEQPSLFITWELDSPTRGVTVWDVLYAEVIPKAYNEFPDFRKETIEQICAIAKFLAQFSEYSSKAPPSLTKLFQPVIALLRAFVADDRDIKCSSSRYVALLVDVVRAATIHSTEFLRSNEEPLLWPTVPFQNDYITKSVIGFESVLNDDYLVTKSFLKSIISLFEKPDDEIYPTYLRSTPFPVTIEIEDPNLRHGDKLRLFYSNAISFIVENIYPSFVRWRMIDCSDRFEIIGDTFRVLCTLFRFKDSLFMELKHQCCRQILVPENSMLSVLSTDIDVLEDALIRRTKKHQFLDQAVFYALSLMGSLSNYDIKTLKMLDNSSNMTLVKKLGRLVRHRLNPILPTLAIYLLQKMAHHLKFSLLACFGDSIDSFRDLLQQRLFLKMEAPKLKVAILEFLTVCAQTQPGLIQHFFQEETAASSLLELVSESDPNVPISALCLIRALMVKGGTVFRNNVTEFWTAIMEVIKSLSNFTSIVAKHKIISYVLNIFSFEIYRAALIEKDFSTFLSDILNPKNILLFLKVASETKNLQETKKAVFAIKHFLILVLARPDHETYLPQRFRQLYLTAVTTHFWQCVGMEQNEELLPALAELMCVLGPSTESTYLEKLCLGVSPYFKTATLQVQVPILTLIHKCLGTATSDISLVTIESLLCILADIFYHAARIYDSITIYLVRPLLGVAASIMYNIIASPFCKNWERIFQQRMVANSIVTVSHVGIQKGEAPEIVQDALASLIRLCKCPGTADLLLFIDLTTELYLPLTQYATPENTDEKWQEVYMLACDLNSALVESGRYYYLQESLNFWTIHGVFVTEKLFALTQLINHCYLQTPDQNFQTIKQLLSFVVGAFNGLAVMTPFLQKWRLQQHQTLLKLMQGAFATLETSVSLLSQPNHYLLLVISKSTKGAVGSASPAYKLTPQLLEVQTKLWEVVAMGVDLYLKIGPYETEFINGEKMLPLLFSIIGLCGRVMSKHVDKKAHPVVNVTSQVTMSLEKGLTLVYDYVIVIGKAKHDKSDKEVQTFIRETSSEVTSLCDMVHRLGLPPDDFSIKMCTALEERSKEMLCK